jgi:hypothetical protein
MIAGDIKSIELGDGVVPSSNEKHLVERFALAPDRQSLTYSFELTDPVFLAASLLGEMRWLYRPNIEFKSVPCDPDATKFFLAD